MTRISTLVLISIGLFSPSKPLVAANVLLFISSPTSWVGQGQTKSFPLIDDFARYSFDEVIGYRNTIDFQILAGSDFWHFDMIGPDHTVSGVGTYPYALRWGFQGVNSGLSFTGQGRGDGSLTGSFQIFEILVDSNQHLKKFAADFVQNSNGDTSAWLIGNIRFNSDVPLTIPEPYTFALAAIGTSGLLITRRSSFSPKTSGCPRNSAG